MATRLFHRDHPDGKTFEAPELAGKASEGWVDDPQKLAAPAPVAQAAPPVAPVATGSEERKIDIRDLSAAEIKDMLPRMSDVDVLKVIHTREASTDGGGRKTVLTMIGARLKALTKGQ